MQPTEHRGLQQEGVIMHTRLLEPHVREGKQLVVKHDCSQQSALGNSRKA